jgi:hypothetical protein
VTTRWLIDYLREDAGLATFVGSRIYAFGASPANVVFPYLTVQRISAVHERHLTAGAGIAQFRYELTPWAKTRERAVQITDLLRERMDNYRGQMGGSGFAHAIQLDDDSEEFEAPTDKSDVGVFSNRMDFIIWASETVTPV